MGNNNSAPDPTPQAPPKPSSPPSNPNDQARVEEIEDLINANEKLSDTARVFKSNAGGKV